MRTYNLDRALTVDLREAERSKQYVWKSEKKFLGFLFRKGGFYKRSNVFGVKPIPRYKISSNCLFLIRGRMVYLKPRVVVTFDGGLQYIVTYNDPFSAEMEYERILKLIPNRLETDFKIKDNDGV